MGNSISDTWVYPWVTIVGTGLLAWAVCTGIFYLKNTLQLRKIIKQKQTEREAYFQRLERQSRYQLNAEHEAILSMPDEKLIEDLQTRKLTAIQVLEAFIAKSLKVTRELNSITEYIPQAEEWAKRLDSMKEVKGPFHGVPISIKDNCDVEGCDSTLGLGKYLYQPADKSGILVQVMMDQGAIPFCKTNVPQTLLSFGCHNPVFGLTKNFHNHKLTPGGSSGGESSLIAAGGSIIGIGSDIGGSVRIPAHFSGVVGIKGTKDRLSPVGFRASLPNVVGLVGVPGLMTQKVRTLAKTFKHLVEDGRQNKYDPLALPLPWNEQMFSSTNNLRIGYFTSLPFFPLLGDTEGIVLNAKKALESKGHTLVPFEMPDSFEMMNLVFDFAFGDKGTYLLKNWTSEPIPPSVMTNYLICKTPLWLRSVIVAIMNYRMTPFIHSTRAACIIGGGADKTGQVWKRLGDRKKMIEVITNRWKKLNLDLILCPTYPFPAVPHFMPGILQPSVMYTMIWNLFDFPAGVVKFGNESGKLVESFNDEYDMVLRTAKKGIREATGMPISVQLVGLPFQEELVLRGMLELENLAQESK